MKLIDEFIHHLWSGKREPAYHFIQESGLPLILTYAQNGTYKNAMHSVDSMKEFIEYQHYEQDRAANMDW